MATCRRPKTERAQTLPKIQPGVVCQQWVRCGNTACRCAQSKGHGPYFYRFWREGGRLRKAYVPPKDVPAVIARCSTRQREQRLLRASFANWRKMAQRLRELEDGR